MFGIDRRLVHNIDWLLLSLVLTINLIGVMTIYSATRPLGDGVHATYWIKQLYWLVAGLIAMFSIISVDYIWINRTAYILYGVGMVLLIAVLIAGHVGMGAQRWLALGPVRFQPSELFKLAFVILLSNYYSQIRGTLTPRNLAFAFFAITFVPLIVIIKQPDLGTAIVVMVLFVAITITKGVGQRLFVLWVMIAVVSVPFIGNIIWDGLKPYQKKRITAFINPMADPEGISYHVQQSKVAVGSGGLLGKGYMQGTQGPFRFLPEKHTDFVFAVYAEEWGFVGAVVLLALYLLVLARGIHTAVKAKDEFARLLSLGIVYMLGMYCFVNVGMTVGLMPVVGIPLPFMSYGGTALVTNFIAIGILINIRARRFELFY